MYVETDNAQYAERNINVGVPQGSILESFFFLICMNDIWNPCCLFKLTLFADDTHLFTTI